MLTLVGLLRELGYPMEVLNNARHPIQRKARKLLREVFGAVGRGNRWIWSLNDSRIIVARRVLRGH